MESRNLGNLPRQLPHTSASVRASSEEAGAVNSSTSRYEPFNQSRYLFMAGTSATHHHRAPQVGPRTFPGYLTSTNSNLPAGSQPLTSRGVGSHALANTNSIAEKSLSELMFRGPVPRYLRKPNCSYNNLIAMAILASGGDSLPVSEIYKYIEQEFPYFVTSAPDGWKNSVRHSLSLGQYFRKVEKSPSSGWHGKKGFHWEIVPGKKETLRMEVEKYLHEEGRKLVENMTASAGLGSAKVQGTQTAYHQPIHRLCVSPSHQAFTTKAGVYPSTGQLTNSPSAKVLLTSASPAAHGSTEVTSGIHGNVRPSPVSLSSAVGHNNVVCSNITPFLSLTQSQPSLTPTSKIGRDLLRIALSRLPPSRYKVDPQTLKELGMDANVNAKEFGDSLLAEEVQCVDANPSASTSTAQCSTTQSPSLNQVETIRPKAISPLQFPITSGHKPVSDPGSSAQRMSGLQSHPCQSDSMSGPLTSNKSCTRNEHEIISPFVSFPRPMLEPTLNQAKHSSFPTSSPFVFHDGYSKNYYKAFWKMGKYANCGKDDNSKRPSNQTKRPRVDEEFMTAITPHFASEKYRLGNVDCPVFPALAHKVESKSEANRLWKGNRLAEEEDCTQHTGGKRGWDSNEGSEDSANCNVCVPLKKVAVKSVGGHEHSRKRRRNPDDTHSEHEGKKMSKLTEADLSADEFFASILVQGGKDKEGWGLSEISSPLPLPFTANDNSMAGMDFCEKDEEFTKLLSSVEMEDAYYCLQSGSSAGSKTDWLLLHQ